MSLETLSALLGYSTLINMGILSIWFLLFVFAHRWLYALHRHWFTLPVERFDAIHYAGMAFYKLGIFLFNLTPYLALQIVL